MNSEEQKLSDDYRTRIQSVDPAICSDLFRCPHCRAVLEKPDNLCSPKEIDSLERQSCIPDAFGIQPVLVNCYCCGEEIKKVEVFEGKHDVHRPALSRIDRKILEIQENFCINCERRRDIEWCGSGSCFGNKRHVFHRSKPGFRIGGSSLPESLRYRLQSGWIPERWGTEFDMPHSLYFRRPDAWYSTSAFGENVRFQAKDQSTGLKFELRSLASKEGLEDYVSHINQSIRRDFAAEASTEERISLADPSDSIWPQFENERPQFSMANMTCSGSCIWLRFQYDAPSAMIEEVFVLENGTHLVSAHFQYPLPSERALKPTIRRMVQTIRIGPASNIPR